MEQKWMTVNQSFTSTAVVSFFCVFRAKFIIHCLIPLNHQSPITNHQSPITNHQSPITQHQSPQFWRYFLSTFTLSRQKNSMEPNIIDIRPLEIVSGLFERFLEGLKDIQMGMNNNGGNQKASLKKNSESCSTEATSESFDDGYHRPTDNHDLSPYYRGKKYEASMSNATRKDSIGTTGNKSSKRTQTAPRAIENIPQSSSYDRSVENKEFERMRYDFATLRMYDRITSARQNQQQETLRLKYQSKTAKLKR